MEFKNFKVRYNAGEKALKRVLGLTSGATTSAVAGLAWYSSLGTFAKIGVTIGLVNPPLNGIVAAGIGGVAIGVGFAQSQLLRKERDEARKFFNG